MSGGRRVRGTIEMDRVNRGSGMSCTIVDVFAERPLAGNQLAVVRGCADLEATEMQAIAREMNFSETTFVIEERPGEARVRIFTPVRELPFAGHPTLGTAWVLGRERGTYMLDPRGGARPGDLRSGRHRVDGAAPRGPRRCARRAAGSRPPGSRGVRSRPPLPEPVRHHRALVRPDRAVRTLDALRRIVVDPTVYEDVAAGGWLAVFAFAEEPYNDDASFAARMLIPFEGLREDPATGSANTAFAARTFAASASANRLSSSRASRSVAHRASTSTSPIRFASAARCTRC